MKPENFKSIKILIDKRNELLKIHDALLRFSDQSQDTSKASPCIIIDGLLEDLNIDRHDNKTYIFNFIDKLKNAYAERITVVDKELIEL